VELLYLHYLLTKDGVTTMLHFVNANVFIEGDSSGSKGSYGPMLHSHIWMPYSIETLYDTLKTEPWIDHHLGMFLIAGSSVSASSRINACCVFLIVCTTSIKGTQTLNVVSLLAPATVSVSLQNVYCITIQT
jgi:hypothetical protein